MRYFFHVRYHDILLEDPEGTELEGIEVVRYEATEGAREIIAERIRTGTPLHIDTTFEVRDENDNVVLMLPFAAVLLAALDYSELPRTETNVFELHSTPSQPH